MTKYKLIKCYPGSPELGTIMQENHYVAGCHRVSDYPYFWEKVIDKDYEILSFKRQKFTKSLIVKMKNGYLDSISQTLSENHYLKSKTWNINSVRRLSDNTIFTIGEKVNFEGNGCFGKHIINEFILKDNYIAVNGIVVEFPLKNIKKIKLCLFKTVKGEPLYEGDSFYFIEQYSGFTAVEKVENIKKGELYAWATCNNGKLFKTREEAEDYRLLNTKCLSIEDISTAYTSAKNDLSKNSKKLIELVKSRL